MIFLLAWLLVASSAFVSFFYLSVYRGVSEDIDVNPPDSWPRVSILVPAHNEEAVVEDSLRNLLEIDYPNYDVVLIDDKSTDSTLEKARKFENDEKLEIIPLGENIGKAGALNKGLEVVDADFTVVQDADSVIETGIIEKAVSKMISDSELGAVIGRIQPLNDNSFFRRLQINEYTLTNFYRNLMTNINTLDVTPGAFSIYRTSDLKSLGGFDEGNLTEDLDMAWRLRKKGRTLEMVYEKTSFTELPENFSDLKGQRVRWARGFMHNAVKHRDMFLNSDYGWFGRFQLPVQVIVPLVAVVGLGMIFAGVFESLYNAYLQISATGLTFTALKINLWKTLLSIQWKIYLPLATTLIVTAYLLREAYSYAEKSVRYPGSLMFYFFAFFAFKAYFWSSAIFKELFRKSRVWT